MSRAPFILTPQEVRLINAHPKAFVNRVRVLAGDRKDDVRMHVPNVTDAAKGHVQMTDAERAVLYGAVDTLVAALRKR
jgi:hypothetical protein